MVDRILKSGRRGSATLDSAALEEIERRYTMPDRPSVTRFLAEHRFLVPLLIEARARIDALFGDHREIALNVATDTVGEKHTQLQALIEVTAPPAEALE
jgi:hypothetical protein